MPDPTTTTVYVPQTITTVEQAEKLPAGVEVRDPDPEVPPCIWRKNDDGDFRGPDGVDYTASELLAGGPIEALVPVTATIERRSVQKNDNGSQSYFNPEAVKNPGWVGKHIATMPVEARYTTPWTPEEEA